MNNIVNIEESFETVNQKLTELGYIIKHDPNENVYLISSENIDDNYTGYILEKETNKVVCYGQKKINDIDNEQFKKVLLQNGFAGDTVYTGGKVRIEYCEDGTLVRLYNYNDTWYTSTTNCTDARKSFWSSSRSFDNMFWEIFNERANISMLDKSSTYYFILLHNENRIVVNHVHDYLVYLYKSNENGENYNVEGLKGLFRRPVVVKSTNSSDVNSCFWNKKRGIVVKFSDNDQIYKVDFDAYKKMKQIRGNNPNIEMRYLELINDDSSRKLLKLYYPEHNKLFKDIHKLYNNFINHIHHLYIESHVQHVIKIDNSHVYFPLVKSLHSQYKKTHKPITFIDVKQRIDSMHINIINDLFRKLETSNQ